MSHLDVTQLESDFWIDAAAMSSVCHTIVSYLVKYYGALQYLPDITPQTVAQLIANEWQWELEFDMDGSVEDISFIGDTLGESEELFMLLAPLVRPGSFITMLTTGGDPWRWYFTHGECRRQQGEICFTDPIHTIFQVRMFAQVPHTLTTEYLHVCLAVLQQSSATSQAQVVLLAPAYNDPAPLQLPTAVLELVLAHPEDYPGLAYLAWQQQERKDS